MFWRWIYYVVWLVHSINHRFHVEFFGKTPPPCCSPQRFSWFAGKPTSSLLPFRLFQVTQVLIGHVLLPPLVHLLCCEPLDAIEDRWSTKESKNSSEGSKSDSMSTVCTVLLVGVAVFSNQEKVSISSQVSLQLHILRCFTQETGLIHESSVWPVTHELSLARPVTLYDVGMSLSVNGTCIHAVKTKNNAGQVTGWFPWDYTAEQWFRLHTNTTHTSLFFPQNDGGGMGTGWGRGIQRGPYLASCHIWECSLCEVTGKSYF